MRKLIAAATLVLMAGCQSVPIQSEIDGYADRCRTGDPAACILLQDAVLS